MHKRLLVVPMLLLVVLLSGCEVVEKSDATFVVTTTFPLYDFAREVSGNYADVRLLLPPGLEPHSFEPKPSDVAAVAGAELFVMTGVGLEPWVEDVLSGVAYDDVMVLNASDYSKMMKLDGDNFDPHLWMNFENDQKIVTAIADSLAEIDKSNAEKYQLNAKSYIQKLKDLDNEYRNALSSCKQNTFITGGHNAYGYLADRYGLNVVAAYGFSPDSEPTPQQLIALTNISKEQGLKYILFEELVSPRIAEAISEETGTKVMMLNPAGNLSRDEFEEGKTFLSIMEENLVTLQTVLECNE